MKKRIEVRIEGMSCINCARTVEKSLKKLKGVENSQVNFTKESALVVYDPSITSLNKIKEAIEKAGYIYGGIYKERFAAHPVKEKESLRRDKIRFITGLSTGIPLMILGYSGIEFPFQLKYLMPGISFPVFIFVSFPIFRRAILSLKNMNLNMDVMYAMGMGVAYISSLMGTFNIILTEDFMFYDTALLLASFLTLGKYLEKKAKGKTSESVKKLMELKPDIARVIKNNEESAIPVSSVKRGDIIIVKPGERIPLDGVVIEGESYVDESMITGEPMPVRKKEKSRVVGGTINKNGVIKIRVTAVEEDMILSRIIKIVREAQSTKPPVQRIADRVVSIFIPLVLIIATSSFIIWFFILHKPLLFAITTFISILVVACPCALGLATPTAVTVGIGRAAELGILIKNGEVLETSEKARVIIFDKTGTLTEGKPGITSLIRYGIDERTLLQISASLEKNSNHPLGEPILKEAKKRDIELLKIEKFQTHQGKGISGIIKGKKVVMGNRKLLEDKGIKIEKDIKKQIKELQESGITPILVSMDKKLKGIIGVSDTLRSDAMEAIKELKKMKMKIVMVTGDSPATARVIARRLGIDTVIAGVLPQDKSKEVEKFQKNKEKVIFVGDGINDAPALAKADIGISMGGGTDIAMESGSIVLMKDRLMDVVSAIQMSKKVMKRIKQNLFWAFIYNSLLIPVAAGLLYPFTGITFKPELAGLAMAMSSVTVISFSLLLKRYIPPAKRKEWRKR